MGGYRSPCRSPGSKRLNHAGRDERVLLTVGDLLPLLEGTTAGRIARRFLPDYDGEVPAGAFPAGWVPTGAS